MANIQCQDLVLLVWCSCLVVADANSSKSPDASHPYLKIPRIRKIEEYLKTTRKQNLGTAKDDNLGIILYLSEAFNVVDERYLSVTIDAGELRDHLQHVNFVSPSVINTAKGLAPAVFRVGGTAADYAIYSPNGSNHTSSIRNDNVHDVQTNYTMSPQEWDTINEFTQKVGWDLIFGLNLKLRSPWPKGNWDSLNAIELIKYSTKKGYNVSWELGNGK